MYRPLPYNDAVGDDYERSYQCQICCKNRDQNGPCVKVELYLICAECVQNLFSKALEVEGCFPPRFYGVALNAWDYHPYIRAGSKLKTYILSKEFMVRFVKRQLEYDWEEELKMRIMSVRKSG